MSVLLESAVCLSNLPDNQHLPLARRMSSPGLTSGAQLRYILQWFGEFSELQREDFLPILAAASQDKHNTLASILASLSCEDKPVSLFQCRIKLFNEWYPTWSEEEQQRLIKGVSEIDADFGKNLQDLLTNGPKVNGDSNGTSGVYTPEPAEVSTEDQTVEEHQSAEDKEIDNTGEGIITAVPVEIAAV